MSNSIVKKVLDWNEEKIDEIDVTEDKHPYLKAFGHGAIDGFVDAAVLMYIPVLIAAYYWKRKAEQK